jgi:hypothetical protein
MGRVTGVSRVFRGCLALTPCGGDRPGRLETRGGRGISLVIPQSNPAIGVTWQGGEEEEEEEEEEFFNHYKERPRGVDVSLARLV